MNTNKQHFNTTKTQKGLTLVELLIAMVISVFLIGGLSQVFISVKRSNNLLIAETELQENARFAFSVITNTIQKAGNMGCRAPSDTNLTSLLNFTEATFRPWMAIEGWEARGTRYGETYSPTVSAAVITTPNNHWVGTSDTVLDSGISSVKNSDILKVWHTSDQSVALDTLSADEMTFPDFDLEQGDIIVLNDCKTITLAQVCKCDTGDSPACSGTDTRAVISPSACNTPGNNTFNPININLPTSGIQVLRESVFYIGKRDQTQSNLSSLFVHGLGQDGKLGASEELLQGLESMQVQYGEDTDNDRAANYFVSADQVSNWGNVVSVRISLLMRSFKDQLLTEPQNLNFNGAKVEIPDGDSYLRRVYSSTIAIRNRNIGF